MKKMKKLSVAMSLMALVFLSACEDRQSAESIAFAERAVKSMFQEICVDGVTYLYYGGGKRAAITVKLGTDSKVIVCE